MRKILLAFFFVLTATANAQKKDYSIQAVNFTEVKFTDNFWLPRIRINHEVTIPASFERCENTGRIKNFEMAAARSGKFCTVYPFDDTDIYKTIEGASFSLSLFPDKKLELYIDSLIEKVSKAQEPDGYLYTARTINPNAVGSWVGKERWEKEREMSHELYNAGHLYEAAAAHFYATGKKNLLNIALRNADLVCSVFGPGKRHVAPGHEVIEMGLVKLYRITGKKEYLATAKDFIDERGRFKGYDPKSKDPFKNGAYWQDQVPVAMQREAVGHAVRAVYLYAGVADIAALTGDTSLLHAIDTIWENMVQKKMYLTGSIGAVGNGERFGDNYELPNSTAYNETCAAIANVYWNHRMFLLHGDAKYIDVLERSLYNGLISGVGLDGKSFFYSNAMEIKKSFTHADQERERSGWFVCSCCPTNITRLVPSIPGYAYAQTGDNVYVNLFVSSNATLKVHGKQVTITQQNNYPWEGNLKFTITPKTPDAFNLLVRIPGWANGEVVPSNLYSFSSTTGKKVRVTINGEPADYGVEKGYALLKRKWKKGDVVELVLPMEVQQVLASDSIKENIGKMALQRGPLVYCAEWIDNGGKTSNLILPKSSSFSTEFKPEVLNGVVVINSNASAIQISSDGQEVNTVTKPFMAIPYYAWAHRGKGEMAVWFPQQIKNLDIVTVDGEERKSGY